MCVLAAVAAVVVVSIVIELVLHDRHGHRGPHSVELVRSRQLVAREGRAPNGAGRVPVGERELPELVVWHEFLDQREKLSLLEPDVRVEQLARRLQRLSIDAAGLHGDVELASEPLELHVLEACLAEGEQAATGRA